MNTNPPWTRTAFPVIAGFILSFLLTTFTPLAKDLAALHVFGITQTTVAAALAALLGYSYHTLAVDLGKRWPTIEKWMLGSSLIPSYGHGRRRKLGAILDLPLDPRNIDFGTTFVLAATPSGFVGTKRKPVGILGNATVGDCVIAMMMHAIIVTTGTAKFTTALAVKLYSAITGYIPGDESTDNGADPIAAAKYWQKHGIVDSKGVRHELVAWSTIKPGDYGALRAALNLTGQGVAVGVSLKLPYSAQDQFPSRKWSVVTGSRSQIEGGHEVLACNDDGKNTGLGTWASEVAADRPFMNLYSTLWLVLITDAAPANLQTQAKAALAAIRAA